MAGLAEARAADSSTELLRKFPAALIRGQIWPGGDWPVKAGHGGARLDEARADDLSTEGARPPCWVHSTHFKV
jgi:hypothetical protein